MGNKLNMNNYLEDWGISRGISHMLDTFQGSNDPIFSDGISSTSQRLYINTAYSAKRQRTHPQSLMSTDASEEGPNNEGNEENVGYDNSAENEEDGGRGARAGINDADEEIGQTDDRNKDFPDKALDDVIEIMEQIICPSRSGSTTDASIETMPTRFWGNYLSLRTQNIDFVQEGEHPLEGEGGQEEVREEDMEVEDNGEEQAEEEIDEEEVTDEEEEYAEFSLTEDEDSQEEISPNLNSVPQELPLDTENDASPDAEKCSICFELILNQDTGTLENCEHVFCYQCIKRWSKRSKTCPIDRREYCRILLQSWRAV